MIRYSPVAAMLLLAASGLSAQGVPDSAIRVGRVHQLRSGALGETRTYMVYEPDGMRGKPLPAIIVLDGDVHFLHTIASTTFLAQQGRMPSARVIAIPNTDDRTRDLTPPVVDSMQRRQFASAGGASRMLQFIGDELLPAVEREYGPSPMRVLVGHSLGGLTAAYAMLTRPTLFQALVMISPSLWFDDYRLTDSLVSRIGGSNAPLPWIFATVGGLEPPVQTQPFRRVVDSLRAHPGARPEWRFTVLDAEDHGSTPMRTTYDALEALFAEFTLPPDTIRAIGTRGIDARFDELRRRFRYPEHTPESAFNSLGYVLLRDATPASRRAALDTFRENVRRFPRSANTYDSLGDAYRASGDAIRAHACYGAAVHLGRTLPEEGESFANRLIIPGASGKRTEVARALGRSDAMPGETLAGAAKDCLGS